MPSVLKNRNFRLLWGGQLVSQIGDEVSFAAVLFTVMALTHNSAFAISGLLACGYVPSLLVATWSGVFVDRWNHRRTMFTADMVRLAIAASLPVWVHLAWLPGLYASMALMGCAAQFFNPSRAALVPDVVPPEDRVRANSLSSSTYILVHTLGAAAGAGLYALVGRNTCFAINVASFVASGISILAMRLPADVRERAAATLQSIRTEFKAGYAYIWARNDLKVLLLGLFVVMLGSGVVNALAPKFYTDELGVEKELFGLNGLALAVGTVVGSQLTRILSKKSSPAALFAVGLAAIGLGIGLFSAAPSLALAVGAMTITGAGNVLMNTGLSTLLQNRVVPAMRGRVFGQLGPVMTLGSLISAGLGGALAGPVGIRPVFLVAGITLAAAGAIVFIGLARLSTPTDTPTPRSVSTPA